MKRGNTRDFTRVCTQVGTEGEKEMRAAGMPERRTSVEMISWYTESLVSTWLFDRTDSNVKRRRSAFGVRVRTANGEKGSYIIALRLYH